MNWLESLIYGFVSGFTEFVPVSAPAHQTLVRRIFGITETNPVMELVIHIAVLLALLISCKSLLGRIRRERQLAQVSKRRRKRQPDMQILLDLELVKVAAVPMIIAFVFYLRTSGWGDKLNLVAIFLAVNGLLLFLPQFLRSGNKDSRSMSRLDGMLIGLAAAAATVMPGVSRTGATTSVALARGASKQHALNWSLLLSIPALLFLLGFDIYGIAVNGAGTITALHFVRYILTAVTAYGGAYGGIVLMRFLAVKLGFSGFAYYSWGAALFSFILYLTIQ